MCLYKVPNLKDGQEYQFRVKAVNAFGPGTPSKATTPVVAEKQPEKPSIDLRDPKIKDITVKAGQDFRIPIPVTGHPPPTITWEKDGEKIIPDERTTVSVSIYII